MQLPNAIDWLDLSGRIASTPDWLTYVASNGHVHRLDAVSNSSSAITDPSFLRDSTASSSYPQGFREANGRVYFVASNKVWSMAIDGSDRQEITGDFSIADAASFTSVSNSIYFRELSGSQRLFRIVGLTSVAIPNVSSVSNLTPVGNQLYFTATQSGDQELFTLNGNDAQKIDVHPGGNSSPRDLLAVGSDLYFIADSASGQRVRSHNGSSLSDWGTATASTNLLSTGDRILRKSFISEFGAFWYELHVLAANGQWIELRNTAWDISSVLFQGSHFFVAEGPSFGVCLNHRHQRLR